jgi:voltage-gated potassium channel
MYNKLKIRLFEILDGGKHNDILGKSFNIFIVTLICLNVIAVALETEESLSAQYSQFFIYFDMASVFIFTIEYIARIWTINITESYQGTIKGRIRYMLTPMALIDLVAILPFYIPMLLPLDLRVIRILRLARLLRVFKLGRYSDTMKTFGNVIKNKKEELLVTLMVGILLMVIASTLIYSAEHDAQPDKFSSIISSMWWAVITLATVGYGDVYPITPLGKFFGAIVALVGIGLFALPAGIIGSGFVEELQKKKVHKHTICPHCGKDLDEPPQKTIIVTEPGLSHIKAHEKK